MHPYKRFTANAIGHEVRMRAFDLEIIDRNTLGMEGLVVGFDFGVGAIGVLDQVAGFEVLGRCPAFAQHPEWVFVGRFEVLDVAGFYVADGEVGDEVAGADYSV